MSYTREVVPMHRLISRMAAVVLCAAFAVADCSVASAGRRDLFHSGLHGFRGFCGGVFIPIPCWAAILVTCTEATIPIPSMRTMRPTAISSGSIGPSSTRSCGVASGGACELSPIARNSENRRGIQQFEWRVISASVTFIQPQTSPTQVVMGRLLPGT